LRTWLLAVVVAVFPAGLLVGACAEDPSPEAVPGGVGGVGGAGAAGAGGAGTGGERPDAAGAAGSAGAGVTAGAAGSSGSAGTSGSAGSSSSGGSGGKTMAPDFDCAEQVVGGPCDTSFLLPSPGARLICDQSGEDDPTCRKELLCDSGVWISNPNQSPVCQEFPACADLDLTWGYCRNEDGMLCFRSDNQSVFCGDDPGSPGYPTHYPLLGSKCAEEGAYTIDCGLRGGFQCLGGVWVTLWHTCK
jgi:hypothetical protein